MTIFITDNDSFFTDDNGLIDNYFVFTCLYNYL